MMPHWFVVACAVTSAGVAALASQFPQWSHEITWLSGAIALLPVNPAALPLLKRLHVVPESSK